MAASDFTRPGLLRLAIAARRRLTAAAVMVATVATLGALAVAVPAAAASSGEVHAVGSGKCLDVPGLSTTPGTQLDIWTCNGGSNQIWTQTSSGQLTVYSGSSQLCLGAFNNQTTAGTKVEILSCNGGAGEQWNVNSNGTITGGQSGLCLDVTGASTSNGALVELWTCNGGTNQQWTLDSSGPGGGSLPGSFRWSSSGVLISPHSDSHNIIAVKDPSVVNFNGQWYVAASTVNSSGNYSMEFLSFANWSQAASAVPVYADQTAIGGGYKTAPMLFYFAPQKLWYVTYQMGSNIGYSTNPNVANPSGWSATQTFYSGMPSIISQNIGSGFWVDSWLICDGANCYLFSMDDNGHLYRSQTSIGNFPNGMGNTVIAASNSNRFAFFEADNVYKVAGQNQYLLVVEGIASTGRRIFTAYTSSALNGTWDSQLVWLAQQGDQAAISALVRDAHPHVTRFAYTLCASPQDAEDAAQEAIIILFRKIGTLRATAALASWMFRIVRNECLRLSRQAAASSASARLQDLDGALVESAEESVLLRLEAERVAAAIAHLPRVQRSVLIMRDIQGMSGGATADALGLSLPAMKSQLHRARAQMSALLAAGQ